MNAQAPPPESAKPAQPSPAQAAAMAAAARPTQLTGRAALLAVVICAIALSLAYPVREYIAQRQQIDQLLALQQANAAQVQALEQQEGKLTQTWYVEQQAEDQLHMCFPREQFYEIVSGRSAQAASAKAKQHPATSPWYATLWQSVQRADAEPGR
jgi:cell division protein FtsB